MKTQLNSDLSIKQNVFRYRSTSRKQGIFKGIVTVVIATALLSACSFERPQASAPADSANVATEEVASNPEHYIGQTVTIRSEPLEKFGPNSFTINDEQFFGGEPILVLNTSGEPFVLPTETGVEVQVTGEVHKFVFADIDRDYNLRLQADQYRDYEDKPAIIAQSIALAPKPGEITQDPGQYYGKAIAVTGEVGNVENGISTFTLNEDQLLGSDDLLVIYANPEAFDQAAIDDGEKVAVTGVLRPFVLTELERDYDLTWDLDVQRQLEAEYSQKPVLIADGVFPSAIPDYMQ